jgi:hypothetical protein
MPHHGGDQEALVAHDHDDATRIFAAFDPPADTRPLESRWCPVCDRDGRPTRPDEAHACVDCAPRRKTGRGKHGLASGLRGECGCPDCADAARKARRMVADRCAGTTLQQIADDNGLTRERVRQITLQAAPWEPWDALRRERQAQEAETLRVASERVCDVCGDEFDRTVRAGPTVRCSPTCSAVHRVLLYQASDDRRDRHRDIVRGWQERTGNVPGSRGGPREGDRTINVGSVAWAAAVVASRLGWPVADRVDPDVTDDAVAPYVALCGWEPPVPADPDVARLVDAVVEHGTVVAAAEHLGMSTASAHHRLRQHLDEHDRRLLVGSAHTLFVQAARATGLLDAGRDPTAVAADVGVGEDAVLVLAAWHRSHPACAA